MNEKRACNTDFITRTEQEEYIIEGYFVRFDDQYPLWEGAYETISPRAFDNTLDKDIVVLWNHDTSYPLGRTANNTAKLRVDDTGLYCMVKINPNDRFALDAYERVKRGDVKQCSFGFDILDEEQIKRNSKTEFRINKVDLFEVSPVTFPAYKETTLSARRKQDYEENKRERLARRKANLKERLGVHEPKNIKS